MVDIDLLVPPPTFALIKKKKLGSEQDSGYFSILKSYLKYISALPSKMEWKRILPKNRMDVFSFCFTLFGFHAMFILEVFYVLPWIVSKRENYSSFSWYFHVTMACLLYINTMLTFWKTISTDTSVRYIMLPSVLKPGRFLNFNF